MSDDTETAEIGALIPDPEVFADLRISAMTGWRWDRDKTMIALGWPPPIYRGRYKHRDANRYQKFKANLLQQAIKRRNTLFQKKRDPEPRKGRTLPFKRQCHHYRRESPTLAAQGFRRKCPLLMPAASAF
jgi:hypothetical protein